MKIANRIFMGYLLIVGFDSTSVFAQSFSGEWDWNNAPSSRAFSLALAQRENHINGQYCAVAQNGNKTDCDDEKNENITGDISGNGQFATVSFSSFFGAANGKAELRMRDGHLIWNITRMPNGGEFYAPKDAVLDRH
ncbi:hypothetical protein [Paraburkholderia sp. C35]|uniref:hypothetical protein n=1 Tax=Paraburkholderia sp. C35 TaxID=2126993 RepID=UPI0013A55E1E|nr:hypothetical protein [Paraburkholderia sp. C35]